MIKRSIHFGYLGNGITVFDSLHEKNGDYEKVAHIDIDRSINFYVDLSTEDRLQIIRYSLKEHPSVSVSQAYKVFKTPPKKPLIFEGVGAA